MVTDYHKTARILFSFLSITLHLKISFCGCGDGVSTYHTNVRLVLGFREVHINSGRVSVAAACNSSLGMQRWESPEKVSC